VRPALQSSVFDIELSDAVLGVLLRASGICKFPYGDFKASDMNGMIMYTFGFAVNIYSSNKCLQTENIETVLSFRCCAT